jgi:protein O-mannosyl-transferase
MSKKSRKKDINTKSSIYNKNLHTFFVSILLISACFIVYHNSLSNPFIWDDFQLIENNSFIKGWNHIKEIFTTQLFQGSGAQSNFYRPLQSMTLILDYATWHLNPIGYHLTNIIFHAITTILIFFLLTGLTKDKKIPLFTSLLFAVHPINTEAITYISGRADPLSAVFFILSFLTYVKYRKAKKTIFYSISLSSFVLALLSREGCLILPLLLYLYLVVFIDKKERESISLVPFLIIGVIYILARLTVLNFGETTLISHKVVLLNRLMMTARAIFIYLSLLILPINLRMERYLIPPKTIFDPIVFLSLFGIICIFVITFKLYKRSKIVFFAIAWFFLNLLPYSNIIPLNAMMAEHWLYLASIGFFFNSYNICFSNF